MNFDQMIYEILNSDHSKNAIAEYLGDRYSYEVAEVLASKLRKALESCRPTESCSISHSQDQYDGDHKCAFCACDLLDDEHYVCSCCGWGG